MADAHRAAVGSSGTVAAPAKTLTGRNVHIKVPSQADLALMLANLAVV